MTIVKVDFAGDCKNLASNDDKSYHVKRFYQSFQPGLSNAGLIQTINERFSQIPKYSFGSCKWKDKLQASNELIRNLEILEDEN